MDAATALTANAPPAHPAVGCSRGAPTRLTTKRSCMVTSQEQSPQEVAVRRLGTEGSELAVFEFQGQLREQMIASLRDGYLATGSYVADARAVSPQGAMSIAVAGAATGATALSAAFSSTLFMATANPATLMTLGIGVGSAVMGTGGIVAQAPFLAVASSLPVVAPILAIQALNTAVMMQQFKQVDRKLDTIKSTLDRTLARIEATHAGELLAASVIVDDVYRQYNLEGCFSNDMLMRLALAERDVRALAARFRQLVEARSVTNVEDLTDVHHANYDAHSAMLASFLDLRIAYLRVCVDMQENPKSVDSSMEHLKVRIDDGIEFWEDLLERSQAIKDEILELEAKLQDMKWAKRSLPGIFGGEGASAERELAKLKAAYTSTMESERKIMNEFHSLIASAKATRQALETPKSDHAVTAPTLVYWQDETGEHSFVTEKTLIS
ncbi:hypothetical protein M4I32_00085 [Microbacterium sp. LRZ72]|uniref:hypothetical protein n=1 Tax=Microbacterium sp. LRZ72 TaxID=2942481 RepID=UPI0029BE936F|nr:hypothetical protein [Microbacterium sp. LRZ72]MDX2375201.1 hypothetical protein [Microbacterium sp. LRZ72]